MFSRSFHSEPSKLRYLCDIIFGPALVFTILATWIAIMIVAFIYI